MEKHITLIIPAAEGDAGEGRDGTIHPGTTAADVLRAAARRVATSGRWVRPPPTASSFPRSRRQPLRQKSEEVSYGIA